MALQNAFENLATESKQDALIAAIEAINTQMDALTNAELRAAPIDVDTGLEQPTTPTDIQPISAASLPLPSGAATAANQQTNALTDAQLRATPVPISGTVLSPAYATKIVEAAPYTYIAKAAAGSAQASAVWQAKRLDETSGLIITYADGNTNFDNVATNLAGLSYS